MTSQSSLHAVLRLSLPLLTALFQASVFAEQTTDERDRAEREARHAKVCAALPSGVACPSLSKTAIGPPPKGSVKDSKKELRLRLKSGRVVILKNTPDHGASWLKHIYQGFLRRSGYHLVYPQCYEGECGYVLVNHETGIRVDLRSPVAFSPEGDRYFLVGGDITEGGNATRIDLFAIDRNGVMETGTFPVLEEANTSFIWIDNDSIALLYDDNDESGSLQYGGMVTFHDGKWHLAAETFSKAVPPGYEHKDPWRAEPGTSGDQPRSSMDCQFPQFPSVSDFDVYSVSSYGDSLSPRSESKVDVVVNQTTKPIALMLSAGSATNWNIQWTPGTVVLAVFVTSLEKQTVSGLNNGVPILISTEDDNAGCSSTNPGWNNLYAVNAFSKRLYGRTALRNYFAPGNKVVVGKPVSPDVKLVSSSDPPPTTSIPVAPPMTGIAALEELTRSGALRKATAQDAQGWYDAASRDPAFRKRWGAMAEERPGPMKPILYNAYVVLQGFALPEKLHGKERAVFFVPKGVASPKGNLGHSTIYDFNDMSCQGSYCMRTEGVQFPVVVPAR
jgi:hypothetical protein